MVSTLIQNPKTMNITHTSSLRFLLNTSATSGDEGATPIGCIPAYRVEGLKIRKRYKA